MISSINNFKRLSSDKIIVTINNCHNFTTIAQSSGCIIDIRKGFFIDFILDEKKSVFRNFIFINVAFNFFGSSIFWCIVNIHDMIILIILLKNRVEISKIFILIFITGDNDAERYLVVLAYLILLLILKFFLKFHSLHFFNKSFGRLWSRYIEALIADIFIIKNF